MMQLFTHWPALAFLVSCAFAALAWRSRLRIALVAATMWMFYGVYELLMQYRVLCSGECNIRVDLLLIYPVLGAMSLAAIGAALWVYGRRSRIRD